MNKMLIHQSRETEQPSLQNDFVLSSRKICLCWQDIELYRATTTATFLSHSEINVKRLRCLFNVHLRNLVH